MRGNTSRSSSSLSRMQRLSAAIVVLTKHKSMITKVGDIFYLYFRLAILETDFKIKNAFPFILYF